MWYDNIILVRNVDVDEKLFIIIMRKTLNYMNKCSPKNLQY